MSFSFFQDQEKKCVINKMSTTEIIKEKSLWSVPDIADLKTFFIVTISLLTPSLYKLIPFFRHEEHKPLKSMLMGILSFILAFLLFWLAFPSADKSLILIRSCLLGICVAESTLLGLPENIFPNETSLFLGYLIFYYYNSHIAVT